MRWWALFVLAGVVAAEDDRSPKNVGDPALQKEIDEAIAKGVAHLKAIQEKDGRWTYHASEASNVAGITALCLYALGASGVSKDDPAMARGIDFVLEHQAWFGGGGPAATYANSLLVLALTRIDPAALRKPLQEAADRLLAGQLADGMWNYSVGGSRSGPMGGAGDRAAWRRAGGGQADNSNTQFAVLALWAAQEIAGHEVPEKTWERVRKHFLNCQTRDGGWPYQKGGRGSSSRTMTAAGIVSLTYALASLDGEEGALERAREHQAVKRGLVALGFGPSASAPRAWETWIGANYYLVYSIERVGTVLDLDIPTWYVPGARWLVKQQGRDGSWGGAFGGVPTSRKSKATAAYPYETSLALLFLTRASRPYVTTRGGSRPTGPVTRKDAEPDTIEGWFDLYVATRAEERPALLPKLAQREAVGVVIAKLRDGRQPVREAAYELLGLLVDRPFLFEPVAPLDERLVMLGPIDAFWKEKGEKLEWDAERARFVVR